MSENSDPLAAFEGAVVDAAAEAAGLPGSRLRTLLTNHQDGVRDLPGVENIVYEWRSRAHADPLLHRDEDQYVLALEDHVWDEFADYHELADAESAALRDAHERQASKIDGIDETVFVHRDAMVLTRE